MCTQNRVVFSHADSVQQGVHGASAGAKAAVHRAAGERERNSQWGLREQTQDPHQRH